MVLDKKSSLFGLLHKTSKCFLKFKKLFFEIVATYFYPKAYKRTTSLVKYEGNIQKILIFEIVLTYFYPDNQAKAYL